MLLCGYVMGFISHRGRERREGRKKARRERRERNEEKKEICELVSLLCILLWADSCSLKRHFRVIVFSVFPSSNPEDYTHCFPLLLFFACLTV